MSDIIQELAELIRNNDVPNTERLRQHNIQIGLRDDQGAGVFVGVTNKGSAVGYERIPLAVLRGKNKAGAARGSWSRRVYTRNFSGATRAGTSWTGSSRN